MRISLEFHLLNQYLKKVFRNMISEKVKSLSLETDGNTISSRMRGAYASKKWQIVNHISIHYKSLCLADSEVSSYADTFFDAHYLSFLNQALENIKQYPTPAGDLVEIPDLEEVTHYNSQGAVYSFKTERGIEYHWDSRENLYYDLYGNAYSKPRTVIIGNRAPRYVKLAYKKLLEIRKKDPYTTLVLKYYDGVKHAQIENTNHIGVYGGDRNIFNEEKFPEPSSWKAYTPVLGSGMEAYNDFSDGDYGWALMNTGIAVSDVFIVKSLFTGIGKAVVKKGMIGGTKRYFGIGMKHTYDASIARWKRLGVNMSGSKHHWLITQKMMDKYPFLLKYGNQTWNLKRFGNHASHMRWGHGKAYPSKDLRRIPYWKQLYFIKSTPMWFRASVYSTSGRIIETNFNE